MLNYVLQTPPVTGTVHAFIEMAVSFNNKYLALFADTGVMWIGTSDLQVGSIHQFKTFTYIVEFYLLIEKSV